MILIGISPGVLINPEHIQFVEFQMTERGRELIVNVSDRSFVVTIPESEFFNAINSTDTARFEQFTRG